MSPSPRYRNGFTIHLDPVTTLTGRTRRAGAVEVELYEGGSGIEVAAFGWVMLADVVPKLGQRAARTA